MEQLLCFMLLLDDVKTHIFLCSVIAQLRLYSEMQKLTFKQTSESVQADLHLMSEWADQHADFHNRQGLLDLRYLNDRFQTGKSRVEALMASKHMYVLPSDNRLSPHAEILRFQNVLGGGAQPFLEIYSSFLGSQCLVIFFFALIQTCFLSRLQSKGSFCLSWTPQAGQPVSDQISSACAFFLGNAMKSMK